MSPNAFDELSFGPSSGESKVVGNLTQLFHLHLPKRNVRKRRKGKKQERKKRKRKKDKKPSSFFFLNSQRPAGARMGEIVPCFD